MSMLRAAVPRWSKFAKNRIATCAAKQSDVKEKKEAASTGEVKPFNAIPGPKALPIIGNILNFIPGIGKFDASSTEKLMKQLNEEYGDIVKLDGMPLKRPVVFLFSPSLVHEIRRKEDKWPRREAMDSLQYYFDARGGHGLTTRQGKDWRIFRSKVNQLFLVSDILLYRERIEETTVDFIERMKMIRHPKTLEMPGDFSKELNKWALETICLIVLDCRLGCLGSDLRSESEALRMINSTRQMFALMYSLENSIIWKILGKTPKMRQFFDAADTVTEFARNQVCSAMERLEKKSEEATLSFLECLLLESDEETAMLMACEMITGGIETIGNTIGPVLFALATNPEAQAKLFAELKVVLPDIDSKFTKETFKNIPYLKACVKEAMRLFPPVPGFSRTTLEEITLGDYIIPKGTNVFAALSTMARQHYFKEPHRFLPERWLEDRLIRPRYPDILAIEQFGFGPRACIAKNLAQYEIKLFLAKIIRTFELQWQYGPLEFEHHIISRIQTPLKLKIVDRKV